MDSVPAPASVLVVAHESAADHLTPDGHPESTARLGAVERALVDPDVAPTLRRVSARRASVEELTAVHRPEHVATVERAIAEGARRLDPDTYTSPGSWAAALHAAGAGLTAVEHLEADPGLEGAFVVARPPGHHATADQAMGFCLFNNIAVTAAHLADRGERVLVVDWDVHHGNGTQAIFWDDERVSFVSLHEANNYPYSGRLHERGGPAALGATTNFALPSGATGDVYRAAIDHVVEPLADRLEPTWVLVSAGFDAHHLDPISDMGLTAGDYATFTRRLRTMAPGSARTILFLEGGYSLTGLERSIRSTLAALARVDVDEETASEGGPGLDVVRDVREVAGV